MAGREPDRELRLAAVADHLRETYRISRRVIRHRRDAARTRGYPVSGRQPVAIDLHDETRPLLDSFLDGLALAAGQRSRRAPRPADSSAPASRVHWRARVPLSSSFGRDWRVQAGPAVALDATERALLQNTAAALELRGTDARVDHVVAHVQSVRHADWKVLVFTSFTAQAHVLAEAFRQASGHPGAIALHTFDMTPADRDDEVNRFHYQLDCRVMIADSSAAEGRNFQMVDELVFLDLPLSPNALEQRIGRVDRFNLRAKPGGTRCTYLAEEGSPWALACSISSVMSQGSSTGPSPRFSGPWRTWKEGSRDHLLIDGFEAFNIPVAEAEQLMADERVELDLLSEIEDTQFFTDFSDASFDDLLKFEDSTKAVADAFRRLRRPGRDRNPGADRGAPRRHV